MKAASDVCLQALDAAFLMRRESYCNTVLTASGSPLVACTIVS